MDDTAAQYSDTAAQISPPSPPTKASLAQTLPAEILERIFGHLGDCTIATPDERFDFCDIYEIYTETWLLPPLCLVCRDWLTPARLLLYCQIKLRSNTALLEFEETVSTNEELAHYTRSLRLHFFAFDRDSSAVKMQQLFAFLPNLQQILFFGMDIPHPIGSIFKDCTSKLKLIAFVGYMDNHNHIHSSILADLPKSITHLCLEKLQIVGESIIMSPLPHLRSLRLRILYPTEQWLPLAPLLRPLALSTKLDTLFMTMDFHEDRSFLEEIAPAIRKLYIITICPLQEPGISLESFTKLTDLVFIRGCWRANLQIPNTVKTLTWRHAENNRVLKGLVDALQEPSFLPNLQCLPGIELLNPNAGEQEALDQALAIIGKERGISFGGREHEDLHFRGACPLQVWAPQSVCVITEIPTLEE